MRLRYLTVLAAVLSVMAVAAPAASAARWTHCAGRYDTDGTPDARGFWRLISVRYVSCHTGRDLAVRYIKQTNGNPSRYLNRRIHVGGWSCMLRLVQRGDNQNGKVTCTASRGRQVTFWGIS